MNESKIYEIYEDYIRLYPQFAPFISLEYFPHIKYNTYSEWKPASIRVLFLVESPPWNDQTRYFYDKTSKGILCRTLFHFLQISQEQQSTALKEFKSRGYFLIDTIKCIFDKNRHPIPTSLIRWSAQKILSAEIDELKPTKIVVLGGTAFLGLKSIRKYDKYLDLWHSIGHASGQVLRESPIPIGFSAYPNDRNRKYWEKSKKMFESFILPKDI